MKQLILVITVLFSLSVYADSDRYQDRAQALFNSMTATEAYSANEFSKKMSNIHIPGTGTWYSPRNLCTTGNTIQTTSAREVCTEWTVNLRESEYGKYTAVFSSYHRAKDKAEGSNGKGRPMCSNSYSKIMSAPLVSMVEKCVLWGVKRHDDDTRTFTSLARARRFADESSSARGSEFCMQEGMVKQTISTTFKVDFYRKTAHDRYDRSKFVGSHRYRLASCR